LTSLSAHKRDYYAGALMMFLGLGAALEGQQYGIGTLTRMGPGFFPTALGVIMLFLGMLIAGVAYVSHEPDNERFLPAQPQWVGWACIIASPIAFIVFGEFGGLLPATFACVFVAAIGDKETTLKQALVLALGITVIGVLLFSFLLKIPFPILRGIWF
jgi:hypothetical protein